MATHSQDPSGICPPQAVLLPSEPGPGPVLVDQPGIDPSLMGSLEVLPVLQPMQAGQGGKFIILLVEDGEGEMTLIQRAIERANVRCELICFSNGAIALDYIAKRGEYAGRSDERSPDLVLLDLYMPGIGGKEILQSIRGDDRTAGIPTVMFSASRDEHEIAQLYRLGANAYVVKPDCLDNFCDVIGELERFWFRTATLPEKGG